MIYDHRGFLTNEHRQKILTITSFVLDLTIKLIRREYGYSISPAMTRSILQEIAFTLPILMKDILQKKQTGELILTDDEAAEEE